MHQLLRTASQHQVSASRRVGLPSDRWNPLFVHELLRFALEDGLIERDGALRRIGQDALAGRIPEGLRDVVGSACHGWALTPAGAQRRLVIGREFQVEVLQQALLVTQGGSGGSAGRGSSCKNCRGALCQWRIGDLPLSYAFFRQTVRRDHCAASHSAAPRGRRVLDDCTLATCVSTQASSPSISRFPRTRTTWRKQLSTQSWRRSRPVRCSPSARRCGTWSARFRSRSLSILRTRQIGVIC